MKKFLPLLFFLSSLNSNAQNELDSHVNLSFGVKNFNVFMVRDASLNYDFMDAIRTTHPYNEEGILSLDSRFRLKNIAALDLDVSLYSDLSPRSVELSYLKKLTPNFGISGGVGRYEFYVNYYLSDIYPEIIISQEVRNQAFLIFNQRTIKNSYIHASPFFHFKRKKLLLEAQLGLGLIAFNRYETNFDYRVENSFEKRGTSIETKPSVAPFVRPVISVAYMPFSLKKSAIGLRFNWHTALSIRSINYDRTTYRWLRENSTLENIEMPKHLFQESQFDVGLNWQW